MVVNRALLTASPAQNQDLIVVGSVNQIALVSPLVEVNASAERSAIKSQCRQTTADLMTANRICKSIPSTQERN
jgi:hypothetical protein